MSGPAALMVAAGCLDERTSSIVGGCWLLETLLGAMWATPLEAGAAVSCWRLQVASGPTALMAAAGCMVGHISSIVGGCWLLDERTSSILWLLIMLI